MTENVMAFDLGASSGRGILAQFDGKSIELKEIHRFPHNFSTLNGHAYWDILLLSDAMKEGLKKCKDKILAIGFDTWGVDMGLIDKNGNLIGMPGSYRDAALDDENMFKVLEMLGSQSLDLKKDGPENKDEIIKAGEKYAFEQTGIASLAYNTLYKLYYMNKNMGYQLEEADKMLLIPNLMEYIFSGVAHTEYSIASTTQMFDMYNKCWADGLVDSLKLNKKMLTEVDFAGKKLGKLRSDIAQSTGQNELEVVSVSGHDTACAVAAVPAREKEFTFLSSGTWSLMGISSQSILTGEDVIKSKISNEGTYDGGYRPTVNIIGLWLTQQLKRNFMDEGKDYSFAQMAQMAQDVGNIKSFIRPDDFMQEGNYPQKICDFCKCSGQHVPENDAEIIKCVLQSLALKYKQVYMSFKKYITWEEKLYIVGGGVQNTLLNQYTANALGIPVITGASEATAVGNVMQQFKAIGTYNTTEEKCEILANSFDTKEYLPENTDEWKESYALFEKLYY